MVGGRDYGSHNLIARLMRAASRDRSSSLSFRRRAGERHVATAEFKGRAAEFTTIKG